MKGRCRHAWDEYDGWLPNFAERGDLDARQARERGVRCFDVSRKFLQVATSGGPNFQFEWLHPQLVRELLSRFGVRIDRRQSGWRDLEVIATLEDPHQSDRAKVLAAHA